MLAVLKEVQRLQERERPAKPKNRTILLSGSWSVMIPDMQ